MSKHIVITGPESSGKTSLWEYLQSSVEASYIPEMARLYLEQHGLDYKRDDLKNIAFQQFQQQLQAHASQSPLIISDTCLLTIAIWANQKYETIDNFILEWMHLQQIDFYILMYPDIPWTYDPQRESEHDRERLFDIYEQEIQKLNVPYKVLKGTRESKQKEALMIVNSFVEK